MKQLTVAAGQGACVALDVEANVGTVVWLIRMAADRGADVVVLPELFITGYEPSGIMSALDRYTMSALDPRLDPVAATCAETGTAAVVGLPVRAGSGFFISALAFGRDGEVQARYDKQHVAEEESLAGAEPGASRCTWLLDGWRLGLGICADANHPQHARAAAEDGCDAYLIGSMLDLEDGAGPKLDHLFAARAADNGMAVVLANHTGRSGPYNGCGRSGVWGPDGSLLASAGAEPGVAVATLAFPVGR